MLPHPQSVSDDDDMAPEARLRMFRRWIETLTPMIGEAERTQHPELAEKLLIVRGQIAMASMEARRELRELRELRPEPPLVIDDSDPFSNCDDSGVTEHRSKTK